MMKDPPHPGQSIWHDDIEPLGISLPQAARHIGVDYQELAAVVQGKASVSPELSLRMYQAFGGGPAVWRGLQLYYDLAQVWHSDHGIKVQPLGRPLGELGLPMTTPLHPGQVLLHECLERLPISVADAAAHLGVSPAYLDDLVNCRADLNPEMAIRLHQAFGGHAPKWYALQANYDVAKVAMECARQIKVRRLWRPDPDTHEPILLGKPDDPRCGQPGRGGGAPQQMAEYQSIAD